MRRVRVIQRVVCKQPEGTSHYSKGVYLFCFRKDHHFCIPRLEPDQLFVSYQLEKERERDEGARTFGVLRV